MTGRNLIVLAMALGLAVSMLILGACGGNSESTDGGAAVEPRKLTADGTGDPPDNVVARYPVSTLVLSWDELNAGDYNGDAVVSGQDVFPIAANFGLQSNYNGNTASNALTDCVDGNQDGVVDGKDLFLVAGNFQDQIDGFNIYVSESAGGPWKKVNGELITREPGASQPPCDRQWSFEIDELFDIPVWYTVTAVRVAEQTRESDRSFPLLFTKPEWRIEVVYEYTTVGMDCALELTSAGVPVIAHERSGLRVTRWTGDGWDTEYIEGSDRSMNMGLAIDSQDRILIAYDCLKELNIARWDGVDWTVSTVDSDSNVWGYVSTDFDSADLPVICYYDRYTYNMKLATTNGTDWAIETINPDEDKDIGYCNSIEFDHLDRLHITYSDLTENLVKYALRDGSDWSFEVLDAVNPNPSWLDIALDSNGNPMICYYNAVDVALGLAWFKDGQWDIISFDPEEAPGGANNSVAFDSNDLPGVSFRQNGGLMYGRFDGNEWHFSLIDASEGRGLYSQLKFDLNDNPLICSQDTYPEELRVAWLR